MATSVTDAVIVITPEDATNLTYSLTVTCTIHPESTADMCEVMIFPDSGDTITGNGGDVVWCMCVYLHSVCTYLRMCVCVCGGGGKCRRVCMHVRTCATVSLCVCTVYVCLCLCPCRCVTVYVYVCVCMYVNYVYLTAHVK